jgi:uncharacterized membrane protein YhaH (DUF805 family)
MIPKAMQYLAQVTQPNLDPTAIQAQILAMSGTIAIVSLVFLLIAILIWFMIFKRTGMNPWLSLLMLVPIVNFVMLLILAFTEWPVQREARMLRAQAGGTYPGPGYAPAAPTTYGSQLPPPPTPPTMT